jgi:hypothetical protein
MAATGKRLALIGVVAIVGALAFPTPHAAPSPVAAAAPPTIAGCPMQPADNIWNARVDQLPIHPRSADYLSSIGLTTGLKADFGSGTWNGGPIGIPYVAVPGDQPRVPVTFEYWDESDPGGYPIPAATRSRRTRRSRAARIRRVIATF